MPWLLPLKWYGHAALKWAYRSNFVFSRLDKSIVREALPRGPVPRGPVRIAEAERRFGGISTSEMADQRPPGGFYRGRKRALRFWNGPKRQCGLGVGQVKSSCYSPHKYKIAPPFFVLLSGSSAPQASCATDSPLVVWRRRQSRLNFSLLYTLNQRIQQK